MQDVVFHIIPVFFASIILVTACSSDQLRSCVNAHLSVGLRKRNPQIMKQNAGSEGLHFECCGHQFLFLFIIQCVSANAGLFNEVYSGFDN